MNTTKPTPAVSASRHTPEPWKVLHGEDASKADFGTSHSGEYIVIIGSDKEPVCSSGDKVYEAHPISEVNALRIVQCVNACTGMADPAAEIAALREALTKLARWFKNPLLSAFSTTEHLLAGCPNELAGDVERARAALANTSSNHA